MSKNIYINTIKWKSLLTKAIDYSKEKRISDKVLEKIFSSLIGFTISTTSPDSESERLFYKMWKDADSSEKRALTKMMIRLIQSEG